MVRLDARASTAIRSALIQCRDLSHVYAGGVVGLENVNLDVFDGEVLGVIGQNGSGKTTLVKHFNGLLKPTSGAITVDRTDTRRTSVNALSRVVGYVFQNPNHQLFSNSVEAEISFGPRNLGLSPAEVEARAEESLTFFELRDVRETNPYRLSFPIRKAVCMAAVYAMRPRVMVLDEPTTGQDHAGVERVRSLVRKLQETGTTVVIVSHDMRLEAEVADRIIVLKDGNILSAGTPQEVFADEENLERTSLEPPQVTQLSRLIGLDRFGGLALTVPAFIQTYGDTLPRGPRARPDPG